MSCQQVPTAPAFNPYPRSVQVGEFEVAIGGGIWVAIGGRVHLGVLFDAAKTLDWVVRGPARRTQTSVCISALVGPASL